MFNRIDAELTKQEYAERLRQGARERSCQQVLAHRPKLQFHLRQRLGDLLITCGRWLKAQPQQEFV